MSKKRERRFILVANAEPYVHEEKNGQIVCEKIAGGLTTALDPMMIESGGVWIAWGRGGADFEVLDSDNKVGVPEGKEGYALKRIKLTQQEVEGFYVGFANEILWPICHSFLDKAELDENDWRLYKKVNQRYARATLEEIEKDDLTWVQDYHLALVPTLIRKEYPDAKIALFWHIPWPSWEIYRTLPWRNRIMEGLLGSDFIGFHTPEQVKNFLQCAKASGNVLKEEKSKLIVNSREVKVKSVPLGVDYDWFANLARQGQMKTESKVLRETFESEKVILGVDRLDYTKGIPQRLEAFELLLSENPDLHGKIKLIQRIPPSRTQVEKYQKLGEEINELIGQINGQYQKKDWIPVRSFHQFFPELKQLIPYYLAADIALVTPLIDGMNLVSKEYIATTHDGVLILSEFAGAASELKEAIQVNPYNPRELKEAIQKAISMPKEERKKRLSKLKDRVKNRDLNWWREEILNHWLSVYER